jgi:hypothetical protein
MRITVTALLLALVASPGHAQSPDRWAPLQRYLGTWTYDGDNDEGKVTCRSRRRLITGGAFVESHRECTTPRGPITQVEVFGYSASRALYLYWGFNGRGVSTYTSPTMSDEVVWAGEELSTNNRCTERFAADRRSSTDVCEHSFDGGRTWVRLSGGSSKKVSDAADFD